MWQLMRQTVGTDEIYSDIKAKEGNKIKLGRVLEKPGDLFQCFKFESPVISRKHCLLEFRNGDWFIIDYGSTNGTYINEEKIESSDEKNHVYNWTKVSDGDLIGLGCARVSLEEIDPDPKNVYVFKFCKVAPKKEYSPPPEPSVSVSIKPEVITLSDSEDDSSASEDEPPPTKMPAVSRENGKFTLPRKTAAPESKSSNSSHASHSPGQRAGPASWKKEQADKNSPEKKELKRKHEPSVPPVVEQEQKKPKRELLEPKNPVSKTNGETSKLKVIDSASSPREAAGPKSSKRERSRSTSHQTNNVTVKQEPVPTASSSARKNPIIYSSDSEEETPAKSNSSSTKKSKVKITKEVIIKLDRALTFNMGPPKGFLWNQAVLRRMRKEGIPKEYVDRIQKQLHSRVMKAVSQDGQKGVPREQSGVLENGVTSKHKGHTASEEKNKNVRTTENKRPFVNDNDTHVYIDASEDDMSNETASSPARCRSPSPEDYFSSKSEDDYPIPDPPAPEPKREPKKAILIPTPIENPNIRRKQGHSVSLNSSKKSPPKGGLKKCMSSEEVKDYRSIRLRQVADKQIEQKKAVPTVIPAPAKAVAKAKVTFRSRAELLLNDMTADNLSAPAPLPEPAPSVATAGPSFVAPYAPPEAMSFGPAFGQSSARATGPSSGSTAGPSSVLTSGRALPVPTASLAKKMPLSNIMKDMRAPIQSNGVHAKRPAPPPVQGSMKSVMHKNIKNGSGSSLPQPSASSSKQQSSNKPPPPLKKARSGINLDQPYKDILEWNPKWLEEQKQNKDPPRELLKHKPLISTLTEYLNYEDYVSTYYPLLLSEFWRGLCRDYSEEKTYRRHFDHHEGKTRYSIGIEGLDAATTCPLVTIDPVNEPIAQEEGLGSDYVWTKLRCHAYSDPGAPIDRALDFGIVTLHFDRTDKNEPDAPLKLVNRKCFAFIQNGDPQKIGDKTVVVKALYDGLLEVETRGGKRPELVTQFTLVVNLNEEERGMLYKERPTELRKISYVQPQMRDFKSILCLWESPLFSRILSPGMEYPLFDSKAAPPSPAELTSSLLGVTNTIQKNIILNISQRINKSADPEVILLHGPPGTGKTSVVVGLIVQLLKGQRTSKERSGLPGKILVCTPSNTAINEIARRLDAFLDQHHSGNKEGIKPNLVAVGDGFRSSTNINININKLAEERCRPKSQIGSVQHNLQAVEEQIKKLEEAHARDPRNVDTASDLLKAKQKREAFMRDVKSLTGLGGSRPPRKEMDQNRFKVLQEADVVFCTLGSCTTSLLQKHLGRPKRPPSATYSPPPPKISVCIIDEATQANEPESLAPLMLDLQKLVLVGDPHQLPATVISQEAADNSFGESLFTRHYNFYKQKYIQENSPVMFLDIQYRMHPSILEWPNLRFYNNKLSTLSRTTLDRKNNLRLRPYVFINFNGVESSEEAGKIANTDEVKLVIEVLRTIQFRLKLKPSDSQSQLSIGVITPYREQRKELRDGIKNSDLKISSTIEVDTVDSYQGREKDILILSCVRSQTTGFLNSPNRLNVALTRARYCLIIIGNVKCLQGDSLWKDLISNAKERRLLMTVPKEDLAALQEGKTNKVTKHFIEKAILEDDEKSQIPEEEPLAGVKTSHLKYSKPGRQGR